MPGAPDIGLSIFSEHYINLLRILFPIEQQWYTRTAAVIRKCMRRILLY